MYVSLDLEMEFISTLLYSSQVKSTFNLLPTPPSAPPPFLSLLQLLLLLQLQYQYH